MKLMYFNNNHRWEVLFRDEPRKEFKRQINFYVNKAGIPRERFKIVMERRKK